MEKKLAIFVVLLCLPFELGFAASAPEISISSGKIEGEEKETRDDKKFYAYRGIPYATAKRFEPPETPKNWSNVMDAEDYGKKCMQYSSYDKKVTGTEDCLTINVFTPKTGDGISKKLLPVIVFLPTSFMEGTSEIYRGHYFMDELVVLATFNSRLNIFGYLSTVDDAVLGNMGLRDQIFALRWVRDNIKKFGGDPNRVTIFGYGDGAVSAHLLTMTSLAKGLFRKVITQGGSALKVNSIQKNPFQAAQRIARLVDCEKVLQTSENVNTSKIEKGTYVYENSSLIVECLKLVDGKKLAEVQKDAFTLVRNPLTFFGPVVEFPSKNSKEYPVLSEHPYSIISSGRQSKLPWMTGLDAQEGLIISGVILTDKALIDRVDADWEHLSPKLLKYDPSRSDITENIRRFYLGQNNYDNVQDLRVFSKTREETQYKVL